MGGAASTATLVAGGGSAAAGGDLVQPGRPSSPPATASRTIIARMRFMETLPLFREVAGDDLGEMHKTNAASRTGTASPKGERTTLADPISVPAGQARGYRGGKLFANRRIAQPAAEVLRRIGSNRHEPGFPVLH